MALLLTQPVFAQSFSSKLKVCPSIAAIKAAGIHDAVKVGDIWAGINLKANYDSRKWSFLVMVREVKNKEEAIIKSNAASH